MCARGCTTIRTLLNSHACAPVYAPFLYSCLCTCPYACLYTCPYTILCTCLHMCACQNPVRALGHTHVYARSRHLCIHMPRFQARVVTHVYTPSCTHACTQVNIHVYTRVCTDVYTHIYAQEDSPCPCTWLQTCAHFIVHATMLQTCAHFYARVYTYVQTHVYTHA